MFMIQLIPIATLVLFAQQQSPIEFTERVVVMHNVEYATIDEGGDELRTMRMDVAFPTDSSSLLPAVILIHGNGWSDGRKEDMHDAMRVFAQGGYFAMSIEYHSPTTSTFQAAVHDCKAAIRFLHKFEDELDIDADHIGVVGVSNGGHLALLTGLSAGIPLLDGTINGADKTTEVACIGSISGILRPHRSRSDVKRAYMAWRGSHTLEEMLPESYLDPDDPAVYLLCGQNDRITSSADARAFDALLEQDRIDHALDIIKGEQHTIEKPASFLGLLRFFDAHLKGRAAEALEIQLRRGE